MEQKRAMPKTTLNDMVAELRKLNARCERMREQFDRFPKTFFRSHEQTGLQDLINDVCGKIMRLERRIINQLISEHAEARWEENDQAQRRPDNAEPSAPRTNE